VKPTVVYPHLDLRITEVVLQPQVQAGILSCNPGVDRHELSGDHSRGAFVGLVYQGV
jgi:hypothetical protein